MSPARRRLFLALAALVAVVLVGSAVVVARGGADEPAAPPVAQDRPGTVVLVPGYGGSTSALQVLAGRLQAAGRTAVVVDLPGDGTGDLREAASALDAVAHAAVAAGAPSVDVVGYSAGGITARWWLEEMGGAALTRRLVTLGTPHHGTRLAASGAAIGASVCPVGCQQLVPGSDLLRELDRDGLPDGVQYLALWTAQDQVVTPPESAELDGEPSVSLQELCPGLQVDHGGLPRSPVVAAVALQALGAADVTRPAGCPAAPPGT